ncbi:MAG: LamG-like jellyroll fold domain-containing protein [Thalassotalea sp.]
MKTNKIAFAIVGVLVLASCDGGGSKTGEAVEASYIKQTPAKPSVGANVLFNADGAVVFQNVGVHDPSIVKADDGYYIFGSHMGAAKSADLMSWELISSDVLNTPLFDTYESEIAEGIEWTDGYVGNWAADVIRAPNGKFWFYYNHCAQAEAVDDNDVGGGCWNRSYLGLAESDNVDGPYIDKGVFLRSGYRSIEQDKLDEQGNTIAVLDADGNPVLDAENQPVVEMETIFPEFAQYPLDNGQTSWHGNVDPNAIDPTAYYDKDGNLWMVYGSYSGGIYVIALDEETGMPEVGQGYGTHLVGGDFRAMEGAFAMYSPESDYYYLMWSVAGFNVDDGYNIRIARSKTPQGPYYDPAGNDIANGEGLEVSAKLMGGFEYTQELGDEGVAWGYQSPGHNSAYYDEVTGRHILVTHTRFPSTSTEYPLIPQAHEVRVHEMFINKDGWLVASPQRFVPLEGDNVVSTEEVMGYYKFINHGTEVNTSAIRSTHISLNADHSVTGDDSGAWSMVDPENINLKLASGTYIGSVKWQWDNARSELVPTFSALAKNGATVWGSKVSNADATTTTLDNIYSVLEVPAELTVNDLGFSLPTKAKDGAVITWQSSNEYYIKADGSVFIPTPDRGDQQVTLDAIVSLNGETTTKSFSVTLKARPEFRNAVAHYAFDDTLTDSFGTHTDVSGITAIGGNTVDAVFVEGQKGKALNLDGSYGALLPNDILNSYQYTVSFWLNQQESHAFRPALFSARSPDRWQSFLPTSWSGSLMMWSHWLEDDGSHPWFDGATSVVYPVTEWHHVAYSVNEGLVKIYYDGELAGSANGLEDMHSDKPDGSVITLGLNYWDAPLIGHIDEFIIYDYELSALDIKGAAKNNLTDPNDFTGFIKDALDLGDLSGVKSSFELPRVGPFVSGISWTATASEYFKIVNGEAMVAQPSPAAGDQQITLTATIRYQDLTETKEFLVTVKSLAPAEYSFEGDLSAKDGVAANGTVTGDRIGNNGGTISFTEGVVGQALLLDGTSGVRLPNNIITSEQYSLALWIKPTVKTDYTAAFFGGSGDRWLSVVPQHNNTEIGPLNSSTIWVGFNGWWNDFNFGESVFSSSAWTHIVIAVDGSNAKVYLNGVEAMSNSEFPNLFATGLTTEWGIGVNYWDTPFNGAVDELKFFYETIDATKVTELYSEIAQ